MFVLERLDHAQRARRRDLCRSARRPHAHRRPPRHQPRRQQRRARRADSRHAATSQLVPRDVAYVNAHGTGTKQNDLLESRGIRARVWPGRRARSASARTKSMLGHLVNASGSVELAITALALRDGFAPPTLNLTDPDPECDLDCIPLVGRVQPLEHALKLSIAFGGHLAAIALRRWTGREACQVAFSHRKAAYARPDSCATACSQPRHVRRVRFDSRGCPIVQKQAVSWQVTLYCARRSTTRILHNRRMDVVRNSRLPQRQASTPLRSTRRRTLLDVLVLSSTAAVE